MEILVLIGIFAFVIAILFRSNEALDRVEEVEKEVKMIEEENGHTGVSTEPSPATSEDAPLVEDDPEMKSKIEAANPVNTPFPEGGSVHMGS